MVTTETTLFYWDLQLIPRDLLHLASKTRHLIYISQILTATIFHKCFAKSSNFQTWGHLSTRSISNKRGGLLAQTALLGLGGSLPASDISDIHLRTLPTFHITYRHERGLFYCLTCVLIRNYMSICIRMRTVSIFKIKCVLLNQSPEP